MQLGTYSNIILYQKGRCKGIKLDADRVGQEKELAQTTSFQDVLKH